MGRKQNHKNLKTEKKGIQIMRQLEPRFYVPTTSEKKVLYDTLGIDYSKYSRSMDGLILKVRDISKVKSPSDVTIIEIKTSFANTRCHREDSLQKFIPKSKNEVFLGKTAPLPFTSFARRCRGST